MSGLSLWGSDFDRMGRESDSSDEAAAAAAWVSVDEVGTVALCCAERLRAADLPAEEVVVDVMTRSTWEARLSDESWRRRVCAAEGLLVGVARPFVSWGTSGY